MCAHRFTGKNISGIDLWRSLKVSEAVGTLILDLLDCIHKVPQHLIHL